MPEPPPLAKREPPQVPSELREQSSRLRRSGPRYAELHCRTNFSFLEGASHADELVLRAKRHGVMFAVNTDAHATVHLDHLRYGIGTAQRAWVSADEAKHEYGLDLVAEPQAGQYDAVILAVAHRQFSERGADGIRGFGKPGAVVFDVKRTLPRHAVDDCL